MSVKNLKFAFINIKKDFKMLSNLWSKHFQLLSLTPAKFTDWLFHHGLIPNKQHDKASSNAKFNLVMHSNPESIPHSGGYIWVNEKGSSSSPSSQKWVNLKMLI